MSQTLFEQGCNILTPRLPYHGPTDPMTTEQQQLTAEDLVRTFQESVDIAVGLGEQVSVCGISAGLPFVPIWVGSLFRNLALCIKNIYIWWDPRAKEQIVGPPYAQPHFSAQPGANFPAWPSYP